MDFGLSSVERYLPSSRLVYRQNKLPKTLIYLVPEALGVLIKAKEKGRVESVKEILNLIDKTNFRISNSIKEQVLRKAGEM